MEVGWLGRYAGGGSWVVGGIFAEVQGWEDRDLFVELGKGTSDHVVGTQRIRMGRKVQHWFHQQQQPPHHLLMWNHSLMSWTQFPERKLLGQMRWMLSRIQRRLWLSRIGRWHQGSRRQQLWQRRSQG